MNAEKGLQLSDGNTIAEFVDKYFVQDAAIKRYLEK